MTLAIDQARYYTPAYLSRVEASQSVTEGPEAAAQTDMPGTGGPIDAAPPLSGGSGGNLLSDKDVRLVMMRGIGQAGLDGYKSILDQYYSDPANRDDPVTFLKNLSAEGLDLLRQAQSMPDGTKINLDGINQEEALNFILSFSKQVDLDNDGLVENANGAKGFRFPPPNAPQEVHDAWGAMSETMSESDQFLLSGKFMAMYGFANFIVDDNGRVTMAEPGGPDWRNIFAEDGFSYREAVAELLQGNEFSRPYNTCENYARTKEMLTQFDQKLSDEGLA